MRGGRERRDGVWVGERDEGRGREGIGHRWRRERVGGCTRHLLSGPVREVVSKAVST